MNRKPNPQNPVFPEDIGAPPWFMSDTKRKKLREKGTVSYLEHPGLTDEYKQELDKIYGGAVGAGKTNMFRKRIEGKWK